MFCSSASGTVSQNLLRYCGAEDWSLGGGGSAANTHRSTTVGILSYLLNLRLLFKNQIELKLSLVFKWLDISELKMPKLVDLCETPWFSVD